MQITEKTKRPTHFNYIAVGSFDFEAEWTDETGTDKAIALHATQVIELLHANIDLGHEYIMTTYDYSGEDYRVVVLMDGIQKTYPLPNYTQRMASKHAKKLIQLFETECAELITDVVEDIVLMRTAAA